jgi:hypothetical protein
MSNQNYFLSTNIIGDFNESTVDNSGYGALPAAEKNQTYFAYFSSVAATDPEIIDQTSYFIKYIIDAQGNVVSPQPNSIDILNIIQNFESKKTVNVTNLEGTTLFNTLLGTKTVTDFGRIDLISISQTGLNVNNYTSSLIFSPPTTTYGNYDYTFLAKWASPQPLTGSISTSYSPVQYSNETSDNNNNYDISTYSYSLPNNTSTYSNLLKFKASLQIRSPLFQPYYNPQDDPYFQNGPEIIPMDVNLRIVTSSTLFPTTYDYILAESITNNYATGLLDSVTATVSSNFINFTSGSRIRVELKVNYTNGYGGTTTTASILSLNDSKFWLEPSYGLATTASAIYWTTGSINDRYITASTQLTNLYNLGYFQRTPSQSLYVMGFNEIYSPFNPSPGDYIRFEYNPLKVFNVKNILTDNASSNLVLDLGLPIQAGTNINNFVLYRLNPNAGNQLILDVPKPPGTTSQPLTGFIKPQHMSKELEDSFTTIIQKLAAEGIVQ